MEALRPDLHVEQVPHPGLVEDQDALHDDDIRRVELHYNLAG
jgi:hypothetical protein